MRAIFLSTLVIIGGLLGWLIHDFVQHRRRQVEFLDFTVGRDAIAAYAARADSLRARADSLRTKLESTGRLRRRSVRAHLDLLEDEIRSLDLTIEKWRKSKRTRSEVDLHRQVVLLYGEASAAARALAADTLPEESP